MKLSENYYKHFQKRRSVQAQGWQLTARASDQLWRPPTQNKGIKTQMYCTERKNNQHHVGCTVRMSAVGTFTQKTWMSNVYKTKRCAGLYHAMVGTTKTFDYISKYDHQKYFSTRPVNKIICFGQEKQEEIWKFTKTKTLMLYAFSSNTGHFLLKSNLWKN